MVFGEGVRITTKGQRHLGAVITLLVFVLLGSIGKVQGWRESIELLAEIVRSQPHAAYAKRYKSKFAYFMRKIDSFKD